MGLNAKHTKVSGSSAGQTPEKKRDGYAKGDIPQSMIGTKVGKTNKQGYTGPSVTMPDSKL